MCLVHLWNLIDKCDYNSNLGIENLESLLSSYCENSNAMMHRVIATYYLAIFDFSGLYIVYIWYKKLQTEHLGLSISPQLVDAQHIPERNLVNQPIEEEKSDSYPPNENQVISNTIDQQEQHDIVPQGS